MSSNPTPTGAAPKRAGTRRALVGGAVNCAQPGLPGAAASPAGASPAVPGALHHFLASPAPRPPPAASPQAAISSTPGSSTAGGSLPTSHNPPLPSTTTTPSSAGPRLPAPTAISQHGAPVAPGAGDGWTTHAPARGAGAGMSDRPFGTSSAPLQAESMRTWGAVGTGSNGPVLAAGGGGRVNKGKAKEKEPENTEMEIDKNEELGAVDDEEGRGEQPSRTPHPNPTQESGNLSSTANMSPLSPVQATRSFRPLSNGGQGSPGFGGGHGAFSNTLFASPNLRQPHPASGSSRSPSSSTSFPGQSSLAVMTTTQARGNAAEQQTQQQQGRPRRTLTSVDEEPQRARTGQKRNSTVAGASNAPAPAEDDAGEAHMVDEEWSSEPAAKKPKTGTFSGGAGAGAGVRPAGGGPPSAADRQGTASQRGGGTQTGELGRRKNAVIVRGGGHAARPVHGGGEPASASFGGVGLSTFASSSAMAAAGPSGSITARASPQASSLALQSLDLQAPLASSSKSEENDASLNMELDKMSIEERSSSRKKGKGKAKAPAAEKPKAPSFKPLLVDGGSECSRPKCGTVIKGDAYVGTSAREAGNEYCSGCAMITSVFTLETTAAIAARFGDEVTEQDVRLTLTAVIDGDVAEGLADEAFKILHEVINMVAENVRFVMGGVRQHELDEADAEPGAQIRLARANKRVLDAVLARLIDEVRAAEGSYSIVVIFHAILCAVCSSRELTLTERLDFLEAVVVGDLDLDLDSGAVQARPIGYLSLLSMTQTLDRLASGAELLGVDQSDLLPLVTELLKGIAPGAPLRPGQADPGPVVAKADTKEKLSETDKQAVSSAVASARAAAGQLPRSTGEDREKEVAKAHATAFKDIKATILIQHIRESPTLKVPRDSTAKAALIALIMAEDAEQQKQHCCFHMCDQDESQDHEHRFKDGSYLLWHAEAGGQPGYCSGRSADVAPSDLTMLAAPSPTKRILGPSNSQADVAMTQE